MPSHKRLSNWYAQLAQHIESGTRFAEALRVCTGPPAKDRLRMADRTESGASISDVMREPASWLPEADRIFICAAAETGRLSQTLQNLSERHERIGHTQLKLLMGLLYPMGVFHIAALILPVVQMIDYETGFEWDPGQHALHSALILVPVWLLGISILVLAKTDNPLLPRLLRGIPLLRRYSKAQAIADFAYAFGTFIHTGVTIQPAWREATSIARDPGLDKLYRSLEPVFDRGESPEAVLKQQKTLPSDAVAFYTAGAQNGTLDEMMLKAGRQYQLQANHAMTLAAVVYPTLLFFAVAAFIIYTIFKIYGGYLDALMQMM